MNTIKFLGTAGARFVVAKQLRNSGGIWCTFGESQILIDPGPGSLVRALTSRPKLDPLKLDAIILTHKHLDHSNDINIMIEAMTDGGHKKRGAVYCPGDALDNDPVILQYIRSHPEKIERLSENLTFNIGNTAVISVARQIHGVETYGLKFDLAGGKTISLISDTRYTPDLARNYKADIVIINVVFFDNRFECDHLVLPEAASIIKEMKPKLAIMSHFGMTMLKAKPHEQAQKLTEELGVKAIAASDGMTVDIDNF